MENEVKKYAVVGTVTISTEEYRDLIVGIADAKHDADKANSERWSQSCRASDAERKLKDAEARIAKYEAFLKARPTINQEYRIWKAEESEND